MQSVQYVKTDCGHLYAETFAVEYFGPMTTEGQCATPNECHKFAGSKICGHTVTSYKTTDEIPAANKSLYYGTMQINKPIPGPKPFGGRSHTSIYTHYKKKKEKEDDWDDIALCGAAGSNSNCYEDDGASGCCDIVGTICECFCGIFSALGDSND